MLQINAARKPLCVDRHDVNWNEFISLRDLYSDYGANWTKVAYDKCADHVDQCFISVSSTVYKTTNDSHFPG
jgi:hypothetical protein